MPDPVVPVTDAERLSDKLNDVRDVLTGFYGLAGEDDTAEKRLLRIAQILSVERSHYPAVGDERAEILASMSQQVAAAKDDADHFAHQSIAQMQRADALEADVERLTRERDEWRELARENRVAGEDAEAERDALAAELGALTRERDELVGHNTVLLQLLDKHEGKPITLAEFDRIGELEAELGALREALRAADDVLCEVGEWANWSPSQRPKVEDAMVLAQNWLGDWEDTVAAALNPTPERSDP